MAAMLRVTYGGGAVGDYAEDPGEPGRFLWAVRWPAHRCPGKVLDKKTGKLVPCPTPDRPQLFRHGTARGANGTRAAMAAAHDLGPPQRGAEGPQYVKG